MDSPKRSEEIQMEERRVLITGATGILGSWVLAEALDRGYEPTVLMRDAEPAQAHNRVAAVLRLVERESAFGRVRVLCGDVRRRNLGLNPSTVKELRATVRAMIHCAASISFDARQKVDLRSTNVQGVKNVLRLLAGSRVPLYHVSTAYVAGQRTGRVLETELHCDQTFNNIYEESKRDAEHLVQAGLAEGSIRGAVIRPGILVGATKDGRISQFLNFYGFLQLIDIAASGALNGTQRLRFVAEPMATKNLVPVDWAAKALWHIIQAEGPSGRTYHLTNPAPVTHESLKEWANKKLKAQNIRVEAVDRLDGDGTRLEWFAHASLQHYLPYLQHEPQFDRTNTDRALAGALPFPHVGSQFYDTLMAYARKCRWQSIFGCKGKASGPAYQALLSRLLKKSTNGRPITQGEGSCGYAPSEVEKSAAAGG